MGDLAPKILELVARLSGREAPAQTPNRAPAVTDDRLRVEAPPGAYKPEPLASPTPSPVPALCQALRAFFALTAREAKGDLPTVEEARAALSEIRRRWDDAGPTFAEAVARQEARIYFRETGRCPYCGERGVFHDPERGGEPA